MDWNEFLFNLAGGLASSLPIVFAFYISTRGSFADAANKAGQTLAEAWKRLDELDSKLQEINHKYQVVFSYLLANLDHMNRNGLHPLPIPDELKNDPELIRLVNQMSEKDEEL